jgi:Tfp pilus assembly protein PilF
MLWLSAACFLFALFSKETAITFPLVVASLLLANRKNYTFKPGSLVIHGVPYLLALGIYVCFRIAVVGWNLPAVVQTEASFWDWMTLGVFAVGRYLRYSLIPYPLIVYHLVPLYLRYRILSTIMYGAIIVASISLVWIFRRKVPAAPFWLMIFGITLIPLLFFKGMGSGFFAERYLYIPTMPIIVLAVLFLRQLGRTPALVVTCCAAILFSFITIRRNFDWHDEETLFRRTLDLQPETVVLWNNLGINYLGRNDNTAAQQCFEMGLRYWDDPRFGSEWYPHYRAELGLGISAGRLNNTPEAITHLEKALLIFPNGADALAAMGALRINLGDYPAGFDALEKAIKLSAIDELSRDYMGDALYNLHRYPEAAAYFREAIRLNPAYEPAKQHLSLAMRAMGQ